ncbi:THAP domain-containing protein 2-like [Brienomyrus brachyistius]|uniref:THAP domain-containing protein 2-like n=1 Tax=Brienomyrus brachyistius TaxID=42636 RepID=UPI0020B198BE|nr:THAP domain-containing protein 2-like [Brienomyrus brachyistius]
MPDFCAAYGCSNQRNDKTKQQGITFHRFPNDKLRRQAWTAALRRKGFEPQSRTVICSCHFKPEDFDRTGQTTRLKEGAIPSVFKFPDHLSKLSSTSGTCRTYKKAATECPRPPASGLGGLHLSKESVTDHHYAFDPVKAKHDIAEAQEQLEKLQRELRNAKDREKRHNKRVKTLLQDLKDKDILTEELQQKLDNYSELLKWLPRPKMAAALTHHSSEQQ